MENSHWVCITQCFFNGRKWEPNDRTGYIAGIGESPYFMRDDSQEIAVVLEQPDVTAGNAGKAAAARAARPPVGGKR